jgi:hypothetical protein
MKKKDQSNYWILFADNLTPQQQKVFQIVADRHANGDTTTRDAYRAFKYYGIVTMLSSDLPY